MLRALKWLSVAAVVLAVISVAVIYSAQAIWSDSDPQPETATGWRTVAPIRTSTTMVVAAHPLAARAGHEALKAGGGAIDAAIAAQAVLTLVEPQSSGIAGGAFMLYWDAQNRSLVAYDGRETAPAAVTEKLFVHPDGKPYGFAEAVVGGRSVGVPGVMRMLERAHQQHGRRPWATLFESAIRLCESGFEVSPRLHQLLRIDPLLRTQPAARAYFYQSDGRALPIGHRLKNPALAKVFRALADQGADALYQGPVAQAMVDAVRQARRPSATVVSMNRRMIRDWGAPYGTGWLASVDNPGLLTLEDLENYRPKERAPVCIDYRQWRLCGFGPPTSGGITTLQVIKMLERFDLSAHPPRSAEFAHLFAEAAKLAFADRGRYIADPDFVDVPTAGLLDPKYLARRSKQIRPGHTMKRAKPGRPAGAKTAWANGADGALPSTSHLVVVDADRNVVSMTTSVENVFGSRLLVEGFILNNQLTDFSFRPGPKKAPVANAVAPHKRPRSSMSPLIVFDRQTEDPVLALGSPGGSFIILYVAQVALAILDGGLSPQEAVELPHVVNRNRGRTVLEDEGWAPGERERVKAQLEAWGHQVSVSFLNSGLHIVQLSAEGLISGADPRREGQAFGD